MMGGAPDDLDTWPIFPILDKPSKTAQTAVPQDERGAEPVRTFTDAAMTFSPSLMAELTESRARAYLAAAPAQSGEAVKHVGNSNFEGWYQEYAARITGNPKQTARDAYAAGLSEAAQSGEALSEDALTELYMRAQSQSRQHWIENAKLILVAPQPAQTAEQCSNCGSAVDPKCGCTRGRNLAGAQPVAQTEQALTDEQIMAIWHEFVDHIGLCKSITGFARTLLTAAHPETGEGHE